MNNAYCPSCSAPVAADALSCEICGADFGAHSAWKPLSEPAAAAWAGSRNHDWRALAAALVVLPLSWCGVFFPLRTHFVSMAQHPSDIPEKSLTLLALGIALIVADLAARVIEMRSIRGDGFLHGIAELTQRPVTRVGLAAMLLLSSLLVLFWSSVLVVVTATGFFIHDQQLTDLRYHALAWAGIAGVCATWTRIIVPNDRFIRSPRLYWLTTAGLVVSLVTAFPLIQMRVSVPFYSWHVDVFPIVLLIGHTGGVTLLILAHAGIRSTRRPQVR